MYDPPDYPYQGLSESLQDFNTDESIFNTEGITFSANTTSGDTKLGSNEHLLDKTNVNSYLSLEANHLPVLDSTVINTDLLVVSNDTLSFEPMLLDEQTVNQFLLPLQAKTGGDTNDNNDEPELLALQSCVVCHEIFTSDADLLDHTISVHVSDNTLEESQHILQPIADVAPAEDVNLIETSTVSFGLGEEWFVCSVCQRVLSTALEVEPTEQLCCSNISGKSSVTRKILESMYVCDYCSGLFGDGEALDRHKANCSAGNETSFYINSKVNETTVPENTTYTSSEFFDCDVCGKQCASDNELKIHAASCHIDPTYMLPRRRSYVRNSSSKMWNCGSCNQLFSTARELYRHKRGEDRPEGAPLTAYVCEECDKVLGSMCALHTHRKMHKNIKPGYPCQICGRRFNQSGHLAIHMRMHTGERPYPCDLCPKAFKVKVERDDHRRTHTGERPFACTACPKTFTAAARLREHARIHTDQRPYKCEICGAAFRRPYARTVHTLIHTGEKPHECDVCGTAFRRSGDMWKHKRTIHGGQLPDDGGS